MTTKTVTTRDETLKNLDAAHALLSATSINSNNSRPTYDSRMTAGISTSKVPHGFLKPAVPRHFINSWDESLNVASKAITPKFASSGLDALALLASRASELSSSSSDEDRESMPPPPPRFRKGRMRSASNPEGMEKWDSLSHGSSNSSRIHFLLPSAILEEELQSANDACAAHEKRMLETGLKMGTIWGLSNPKIGNTDFSLTAQPDSSPNAAVDFPMVIKSNHIGKKKPRKFFSKTIPEEDEGNITAEESSEEDEANLEPSELLQRARNKLFEDLSLEPGLEKGDFIFPHLFDKYKEIYNKNGRIGIYTPLERAAIIAKFHSKRNRRVWNKKIRYNCRKNLADRRMRVKGRFVKREVEQSGSVSPTSLEPVSEDIDEDMPDVNDPDAGFKPTPSQPFKRTRRHTIT